MTRLRGGLEVLVSDDDDDDEEEEEENDNGDEDGTTKCGKEAWEKGNIDGPPGSSSSSSSSRRRRGRWVSAPPRRGTVVLNIGDCLADWSGARLRSTVHRVVAPTSLAERWRSVAEDHGGGRSEPAGGAEAGNNRASDENGASSLGRISCVFFVTPDPDTVVSLESSSMLQV